MLKSAEQQQFEQKRLEIGLSAYKLKLETKLTYVELAEYYNVTWLYIRKAINHTIAYLEAKKEPSSFLIDHPEPIEMKYVRLDLEPEWMVDIDFRTLPPTTDEKAKEYMMNKF